MADSGMTVWRRATRESCLSLLEKPAAPHTTTVRRLEQTGRAVAGQTERISVYGLKPQMFGKWIKVTVAMKQGQASFDTSSCDQRVDRLANSDT